MLVRQVTLHDLKCAPMQSLTFNEFATLILIEGEQAEAMCQIAVRRTRCRGPQLQRSAEKGFRLRGTLADVEICAEIGVGQCDEVCVNDFSALPQIDH